jgi:TonB family protein
MTGSLQREQPAGGLLAVLGGLLLLIYPLRMRSEVGRRVFATSLSLVLHGGLMAAFFLHPTGSVGHGGIAPLDPVQPVTVTLIHASDATEAAAARSVAVPAPSPSIAVSERTQSNSSAMPAVAATGSGSSDQGAETTASSAGTVTTAAFNAAGANDYGQKILEWIERHRRPQHDVGLVQVAVRIGRQGEILDLHIVGGSTSKTLEDEAEGMVQRSAPLPPIPEGLPDHLTLTLPIAFDPLVNASR